MLKRQALILFVLAALQSCITLPLQAQTKVSQYEPYDIVLIGSSSENPYQNFRLWADLSGPNNTTFSIDGFWDGGTTWKIRVALPRTGTWTFITHSDDPLLDNISSRLECTASANKGFVEQRDRHFVYENGSPLFRMGDTCWRMFRSKNAPYETHFKPYIDARAKQGFNFIMGAIHTNGEPSVNEGGSLWYNDRDLDRLQPGYFQWVDKRINYMKKSGVIAGIVLVWSDTFADFYQPPFNRETFSRFRRYVVARYAAYNVFWILCGEYSETMSPEDYDYHAQMMRYGNQDSSAGLLDCGDPYDHPLSIHPGGQESTSRNINIFHDWLMYTTHQMYGAPSFLHHQVLQDHQFDLPVCNDEFGYEGPTDPQDPYYFPNNQNAADTRQDAWTLVCSGAYFTWGNIYTYTGKSFVLRTDKLESAGSKYMSHLGKFIRNGVPIHEMVSDQSCVKAGEAYCLAERGNTYLIYFPTADAATIDLQAPGTLFQASWYDPSAGDSLLMGAMSGDHDYELDSPFGHDGVLYVQAVKEQTVAHSLAFLTTACRQDMRLLEWQMGNVSALAGFVIERRQDEDTFRRISSFNTNDALLILNTTSADHIFTFVDSTAACSEAYEYRLTAIDLDGGQLLLGTIKTTQKSNKITDQPQGTPLTYELPMNYPNPFAHTTTMNLDFPRSTHLQVSIYNLLGRRIRTLYEGQYKGGIHPIEWDGRDDAGHQVDSGIYLCRVITDHFRGCRKMIIQR